MIRKENKASYYTVQWRHTHENRIAQEGNKRQYPKCTTGNALRQQMTTTSKQETRCCLWGRTARSRSVSCCWAHSLRFHSPLLRYPLRRLRKISPNLRPSQPLNTSSSYLHSHRQGIPSLPAHKSNTLIESSVTHCCRRGPPGRHPLIAISRPFCRVRGYRRRCCCCC